MPISPEIHAALQNHLRVLKLHPKPTAKIQLLHDTLVAHGITVRADSGITAMEQNGVEINPATPLRVLVTKCPDQFDDPLPGGIKSLDVFGGTAREELKAKSDYISKFGSDAYARLVRNTITPPGPELGPDSCREDFAKHTGIAGGKVKSQFISEWGLPAYEICMSRRTPKAAK